MTDARIRVMKFGGSSLGAPDRLYRVLELIIREREHSPVAIVVSAMGDTTDHLIEAAEHAAEGSFEAAEQVIDRIADLATTNGLVCLQKLEHDESLASDSNRLAHRPEIIALVRELLGPLRRLLYGVSLVREKTTQTLDLIMSFGERLSASVVAELLSAAGSPATFVDARSWTITDDTFGSAIVDWPRSQEELDKQRETWGDTIPVCTGFLGRTEDERTTTLGRNGSDYTATLLARGLDAAEVVRWTDVSGVMTADPGLVDEAYPLEQLSYMEALELANFGARVFHPRTMIPLIESGIPMRIRNTMMPDDPGTKIDAKGANDIRQPTSVTSLENLALLDIEWRRVSVAQAGQIGDRVLNALDRAGVTVWMATQSAHGQSVAVVVPIAQMELARATIQDEFALEYERREINAIGMLQPVTILTLVAEAMGHTPNVAGRLFYSLGTVGVNIRAIAQGASSRSISCVIDAHDTAIAVRTVHSAFNFTHQVASLLIFGVGTVGAQLLDQIRQQREDLEEKHNVLIQVAGIATSSKSVFDETGIDIGGFDGFDPDSARLDDHEMLDRLSRMPMPVLVDVTAAGGMDELYRAAFERGIHVVAANKKPLTIAADSRDAMMLAARDHHRQYNYETTVGASLPVIETLKNIVRTGDRVKLIEGSFSGTLGYLTNELMSGVKLDLAVRTAQERGYTEPNPADDLSGLDVARKAMILAREMGLSVELSDVVVEPLVPAEVLEKPDLESFYAALSEYTPTMTERIARYQEEDLTLRYLARIDPDASSGAKVTVGPVAVPASHPATRLRGAEAFVAFTTRRYSQYPLLVQGAGAGGDVTASGVLADILRVALTFRGR